MASVCRNDVKLFGPNLDLETPIRTELQTRGAIFLTQRADLGQGMYYGDVRKFEFEFYRFYHDIDTFVSI